MEQSGVVHMHAPKPTHGILVPALESAAGMRALRDLQWLTRLRWFADGKLAGGWLAKPTRLDGLLVRWDFALHPNGRLRAFSLDEARSIGGHAFEPRSKVSGPRPVRRHISPQNRRLGT